MTGADRPVAGAAVGPSVRSAGRWLLDQLTVVVVALLLALGLRMLVIEPYRIPSESMLPTLRNGDHVFVAKWVFGARLPFGKARLPAVREPRRGEVVIFELGRRGNEIAPRDERPDLPAERFVKRVVGLPGDRVEGRGGALWVNGQRVDSWPTGETWVDAGGRRLKGWSEILSTGQHSLARENDPAPRDFVRDVPVGRYFVMGDYRDRSTDSRILGTVPRADLIGPVWMIYWSWGERWGMQPPHALGSFWDRLQQIRWDRVGERVH